MVQNHLACFLASARAHKRGASSLQSCTVKLYERRSNLSSRRRRGKDQFVSALNAAGLSGPPSDVENPLTGCTGEVLAVNVPVTLHQRASS